MVHERVARMKTANCRSASGLRRCLWLGCVIVTALAGCAVRPQTPELAQVVPGGGYHWSPATVLPDNDPHTLLILTFSGGGTRAAAFSFGVLEELRRTMVAGPAGPHSALSEIDLITGTSGGSFTALSYALYGERLFDIYEDAFLQRNVEMDLVRRLLNPITWPKVLTEGYGRSELAEEYYDEILFHGATFGDLLKRKIAIAVVGATDVTTGMRIDFSQRQFDVICDDLSRFRLARAAAASSAVPVVLSPVTLDNHGGNCGYKQPPWLVASLQSNEQIYMGNRADLRFREALLLENSRERPYLHLVDGGLADNLALLSFVESLQEALADASARAAMDVAKLRRIAIVIVNAASAPSFDYDKIPEGPGALALLAQSVSVPMDRFSTASIAALQDMIAQWRLRVQINEDARRLGQTIKPAEDLPAIDFTVVDVSFDSVTDPQLRRYLQNLPTSFALSKEAVDSLRTSGAQVLRDSPAFRKFIDNFPKTP
jgi:NTE family protein